MKKITALFLSICLVVFTLMPLNAFAATSEGNYVDAVDLSVLALTNNETDNCVASSTLDIIQKGIWVDPASDMGNAEGQTRIRNILVEDSNGDGIGDRLAINPWGDTTFHITLGMNSTADFATGATALALHINNTGSTGLWPDGSIGKLNVTLLDDDDNSYSMLPSAEVADETAENYYVNLTDNALYPRNVSTQGYYGFMCKKDGWVIIPLSAFEAGYDLADITKVKIEASTIWDVYFTIAQIGFVKDAEAFVTELTGITPTEEAKPDTAAGYMEAIDFSVLTPATYRDTQELGWAGVIPSDAEILTKKIWVDAEESKGFDFANGQTNIHGFYATDKTNDGKTDVLSPMPNNDQGMRFTLGVNTNTDFSGAEAIAVHIDNIGSTVWSDASILGLDITLYDSEDNTYRTLSHAELEGTTTDAICSYYVNLVSKDIDVADIVTNGYTGWRANKNGWYIIDIKAFEEGYDLSDIKKIQFKTGSWWGGEMGIDDIGFIYNIDDFITYLVTEEVATAATPDAATVFAKGSDKLILNPVAGVNYSLDGINWSDSNVFEGLTLGNTYTVYQYIPATKSAKASAISEATILTLYKEGDINHDGIVSANDLISIKRYLLNAGFTGDIYAADADMDGVVTIKDFIRMKKLAS